MPYQETYRSRDNIFTVALENCGVPVNLNGITKMELLFPDFIIDSKNNPEVFDWSKGAGIIEFRLGNLQEIRPGKYLPSLILYDQTNPNGVNFGKFSLEVKPL